MDDTYIKVFEHCRLIIGMVVSLAVARLLNGLAKFVQHPKKIKVYSVHICWVLSLLLLIVHFWWWEFKLREIHQWTFEAYALVLLFAINFFLLCSLLFPDTMEEYTGFEDYFISRRRWFFGILALNFAIDLIDTALKGAGHFYSLGIEYPIRNSIFVLLCIVAMVVSNFRFQIIFAIASLIYELSFIFRQFHIA
ncbi:MAG TPA: hypothetical protein V6C97_10175 [Oculatellaceae cyanobacterium]